MGHTLDALAWVLLAVLAGLWPPATPRRIAMPPAAI
jgi:hypothetical protein